MNEHQTLLHAWQVGRQTYRLLLLQVLYETWQFLIQNGKALC
jgi:hypothetical protein